MCGTINRLALGAAQFGLSYGLASNYQQVEKQEVTDILLQARMAGLEVIDTAASYGQSEQVLGAIDFISSFKIMSKTYPVRQDAFTKDHLVKIETAFQNSLNILRCRSLHALLVHDAKDLLVAGSDLLWSWMKHIKSEGLVHYIGVSVYDSETARILLDRYDPDIIQIPYNIFDQRLDQDNFFNYCTSRAISVHVRSIFLQGVILMNKNLLPHNLKGLQTNLIRLAQCAREYSVSDYLLALAFVARRSEIKKIVVGVHNKEQLLELLSAWQNLQQFDNTLIDWSQFDCKNASLIDPRLWP